MRRASSARPTRLLAGNASFPITELRGSSAPMTVRAFITGLAGTELTPAERAFVRASEPWGLSVFKRNIETPAQVASLAASFHEAVGRDAAVLVDQEGGRVQRLGPPHWPAYPPGASYGRIYDRDRTAGLAAARLGSQL